MRLAGHAAFRESILDTEVVTVDKHDDQFKERLYRRLLAGQV
jgi:hypothetical protein